MKKFAVYALLAASALSATPASAALLLGKTVELSHQFPALGSPDFGVNNFTVGTSAPVDYAGIATYFATDTTFNMNVFCGQGCGWTTTSFNGFVLSDVFGTVDAFTGVAINAATNYLGFDASRISFDANNIYVNLQGLTANGTITLDINGAAGGVPEPAAWAMMLAGFGLVGVAMRRRETMQVTYA
jgi:hypothetical protein